MARKAVLLKTVIAQALLLCLITDGISTPSGQHYYYQGASISGVSDSQAVAAAFLIGDDRIGSFQIEGYSKNGWSLVNYVGDGKSNDILIEPLALCASKRGQSKLQSLDYQAYGQPSKVAGNLQLQTFGYNNEYQDPDTLLTYLKARDYDVVYQHFMTMDSYPLFNRYHFTNQDPINQIDPSGHWSFGKW